MRLGRLSTNTYQCAYITTESACEQCPPSYNSLPLYDEMVTPKGETPAMWSPCGSSSSENPPDWHLDVWLKSQGPDHWWSVKEKAYLEDSCSSLSLLLHFDEDFSDSSPNNLQITTGGDVEISTSESRFGYGSVHFGGSGGYLRTSIAPFVNDDFTIEFWLYRQADSSGQVYTLFEAGNITGGQGGVHLYVNPDGYFALNDGFSPAISGGNSLLEQWQHIAITRKLGTNTLYVGGISIGTSTQTFPVTNDIVSIGGAPNYNFYINGYIDEFRIVRGKAVYTENFTVPDAPFSANNNQSSSSGSEKQCVCIRQSEINPDLHEICGGPYLQKGECETKCCLPNSTQLLVHFDETSKRDNNAILYIDFEDGLKNNGSASLCIEADPTNPAKVITKDDNLPSNSAYFNGSSYLTTPFSDDFAFGSGDFTVEGWIYPNARREMFVISAGSSISNYQFLWGLKLGPNHAPGIYWTSPFFELSASYDFKENNWYHIAACRSSGTLRLFVNGEVQTSGTDSTNYTTIWQDSISIGRVQTWNWWTGLQQQFFSGYMDEICVRKGQSSYVANFSPSTSPSSANSSLMLRFNGKEGDLNFVDSSPNESRITNNGGVVTVRGPGISRYGQGSGYFNGDSIYVKTDPVLSLGTGDFTIETWVYMEKWGSGYATLYDGLALGGNYYRSNCFCWALIFNSNNNTSGVYYNGQWHNFNVSVSIALNSWSHHAIVRREGVLHWYMNGKLLGVIPFDLDCTSANCVVGRESYAQINFFNGYLDDYKITKSAKYENLHFFSPESAFKGDFYQYPYSLLMHFDGSFAVQSSRNLSVSVYGNAQISSLKSKFGGYSVNFNGYSDAIILNGSDFVKFKYNDFTIEGWININQSQNNFQYIFEGPNGYLYFYKNQYYGYDGLYHSSLPQASFPIEDNTWHHFALIRRKKITSLFVDGILVSSGVDNNDYSYNNSFSLGNNYYRYQGTFGYIDEFRISNREALYEGSFHVPDESFLYDLSLPSLIIYFDGDIEDYSPNQINTSSHGGGVAITSDESKWGEQSVYFGDLSAFPSSYIDAVNSNNALNFGSQDFTIECWFHPTTYSSPFGYQALFSGIEDFTYGVMMDQQGYLRMWLSSTSWYWNLANEYGYLNEKVILNEWNHVCMIRSGGVFSIYLNGKNVGQKYTQANVTIYSGSGIRIGSWGNGQYGINKGYINEFRVVKGEALYSCSFDPPQSGFYESSSSSSSSNPTSLMLHMDGFIFDESGSGTKIIQHGNLEINALTKKFGQQSAYFDGNSYFSFAPNSQSLNFGVQDFTIEFWMHSTRNYQEKIITTQGNGFFLQKKYGNKIELVINAKKYSTPNPVIVQNSWQHIALSRENGIFRLFVSGDMVLEINSEVTYPIPNILNIGKDTTYLNQYPFEGYLDEIRVTKGLALYSQNFQEPTQAFSILMKSEVSRKTSLLMHFNGQDQSINFVDSGPNKLTFNEGNFNNAIIRTSKKVFGNSSGYFNGNSYLTTSSNGFDFGTGDFTVEAWVYLEENYQDNFIFGAPENSSWNFGFNQNNQFGLGFGRKSVGWDIVDTSGPFPVNVWRHVAVCRKNGMIRLFVNGKKVSESLSSISYSNQSISIGGDWNYGNMKGYVDEIRILKDLGVYEEDFAIPSEEYFETNWDVVLLNFDGQNGETNFINSASYLVASNVGNVALSTDQSKFGLTSAKFNGNGDRVDIEGSKLLFLENEDYTVECFVYITDWSGEDHARIWSFEYEQSWYYYFYENWSLLIMNDGTGTLYLNKLGTSEGIMTPPGVISLNEWTHIALTRQGNMRYLYVNGRIVGSYSQRCLPDPFARQASCRLSLGGSTGTYYGYLSYSNFKGYIDEFRVTKGLARYKNQSVLIDSSSEQTIVDSSPNQIAIKSNGVKTTPEQSKFGGYSGYFSGNQDFLEIDSEDLAFGKDDFTIEFWIRPISYPKGAILSTGHKAGDFYKSGFVLGPSNFLGGLRLSDDNNNDIVSGESCLLINQWRHIAIVRHNYHIKLYVSGNLVSSSYSNDDFTSSKLIIGIDPSAPSLSFNGYIDNLRILRTAAYKSNFEPPGSQNNNYLSMIGDQLYCISLAEYDANLHEICGGPYYSTDQCGSCASSSSSRIVSSSSSSSSQGIINCFPIISIVEMPDGSKSVNVECSDQPASSTSFCVPEVPPSEDIICPDGRQIGKTYYLPNFSDCTWVAYQDIYGVCDSSSSSSSSSSSLDCKEQVRHCLYSNFSLETSLFALEEKPPPCTYRTYCLPEGCVEICETEGSTPISSCDPACCTPGYCLSDCSTYVPASNCIACGVLGGMWFSTNELLSAYLDENCKLECWECSQDENNECSPVTISGQYKYPKNWMWTGQKEITCEDLGHYADEGACTDDCCDCYCGASSCVNSPHKTIKELAADCGDCCASSGGGIIVYG